MLTAVNFNVNLNVNLNVERLPELLPISDNFSADLVQHFLSFSVVSHGQFTLMIITKEHTKVSRLA